jgi:hypothetical protein
LDGTGNITQATIKERISSVNRKASQRIRIIEDEGTIKSGRVKEEELKIKTIKF